MKSSFVWTLALSTNAALSAHVPNSYEDWVNEFKPCGQSCLETMYTKVVGNSCGSNAEESTSESKIQCICRAMGSNSPQVAFNAGKSAGACYVEKCGLDSSDLPQYISKASELVTLCYQQGYSGRLLDPVDSAAELISQGNNGTGSLIGSSPSGSIIVPTSNPIGASHTFDAAEPTGTSSGPVVSDGASSSLGHFPLTFGGLAVLGALFACK